MLAEKWSDTYNTCAMSPLEESLLQDLVPVFPLPNCVLLPGALLPLHIFEPRYRTMVHDLMTNPPGRRHLAVALLKGDYQDMYHSNLAPIHRVVGVGEVIQHASLPDGCCNILTLGKARAKITFEDTSGTYRRARLKLMRTEPKDMLATVHKAVDQVRSLLTDIARLGACDRQLLARVVDLAPTAAGMIDVGAFHLIGPRDSAIKQLILEEEKLEVRAEILARQLHTMIKSWQANQLRAQGSDSWPPKPHTN